MHIHEDSSKISPRVVPVKEFKAMGLFGSKNSKDKTNTNIDLMRDNLKKIEVLKVYGEACSQTVKEELHKIEDSYKFASPSDSSSVQDIDKKIRNKLDDLKIDFVKMKNGNEDDILATLKDLRVLIASRG